MKRNGKISLPRNFEELRSLEKVDLIRLWDRYFKKKSIAGELERRRSKNSLPSNKFTLNAGKDKQEELESSKIQELRANPPVIFDQKFFRNLWFKIQCEIYGIRIEQKHITKLNKYSEDPVKSLTAFFSFAIVVLGNKSLYHVVFITLRQSRANFEASSSA
jgi:hypothetical protein